jgi:hypothetical protein
MDGVKAKLNAMREEHSAAEKREEMARIKSRNDKERLARAEDATAALRRRIKIAQMNLEKVEDQTDGKLDRLERLNKQIYDSETCRRQLELKEMKEDNTLIHLESRHKSRQIFAEEADQRHREACNKLRMLQEQTAKVYYAHIFIRAIGRFENYIAATTILHYFKADLIHYTIFA